ncbi:tRNA pseudouridine(38-40) synthase TruA [Chelatococcus reniformis]|uniref:tRNA pseudouridine synthase A n=1 Tax=Chelatococcus reniformis TaxID=1494448 RepID=A0A916UMZ0_9HYPH|nr:tRNA pseudouridine(38-40) synthase TruA [Chelatococcus reniformis]GGC79979.1 tRNA pseudouridine synthase A [Chelatococcus reniformis]
MPRYKLTVEYDGFPYVGWQWQDNGRAVQQAMEEAVERFAGERVRLQCAGRTDTGVHALGQVAHLDLADAWRTDTVRDAINAHLKLAGDRVAVVTAEQVGAGFDARHSALKRHYLYRILNRRAPPALGHGRLWHVPRRLDAGAMQAAAQLVLGQHDFTTFRAAECQASSPVRTLDVLDVARSGDEITVRASARSFLHHQVRSLVGSLEQVGCGRWPPAGMRAALDARDRRRCGPLAPAHGLYFVSVDYPPATRESAAK